MRCYTTLIRRINASAAHGIVCYFFFLSEVGQGYVMLCWVDSFGCFERQWRQIYSQSEGGSLGLCVYNVNDIMNAMEDVLLNTCNLLIWPSLVWLLA